MQAIPAVHAALAVQRRKRCTRQATVPGACAVGERYDGRVHGCSDHLLCKCHIPCLAKLTIHSLQDPHLRCATRESRSTGSSLRPERCASPRPARFTPCSAAALVGPRGDCCCPCRPAWPRSCPAATCRALVRRQQGSHCVPGVMIDSSAAKTAGMYAAPPTEAHGAFAVTSIFVSLAKEVGGAQTTRSS